MTTGMTYTVEVESARRPGRAERWQFVILDGLQRAGWGVVHWSGYRYASEASARAAGEVYLARLLRPTHLVDPDATHLG